MWWVTSGNKYVLHQAELVGRTGIVWDLLVLVLEQCDYACHTTEVVLQ